MAQSNQSTGTFRHGTGPLRRALVLENPDPSLDDHLRALGIEPTRIAEPPSEDALVELLRTGRHHLIYKRSRIPITERVVTACPDLAAHHGQVIGRAARGARLVRPDVDHAGPPRIDAVQGQHGPRRGERSRPGAVVVTLEHLVQLAARLAAPPRVHVAEQHRGAAGELGMIQQGLDLRQSPTVQRPSSQMVSGNQFFSRKKYGL